MEESNHDIDEIIKNLLNDFANEQIMAFHVQLDTKKINKTRELFNSFNRELLKVSANLEFELRIFYTKHGSYRDMAYRKYSKQAPVDAIEDWIKKVGVEKFKTIPSYKNGTRPTTDTIAIKKLAWAIAKSYKKRDKVKRRNGGWRAKKEFAKRFMQLSEDLATRIAPLVGEKIASSLSN